MNLFELFVKIGVDDQASGQLKKITASLGNGLKAAAKVGLGAMTTVSAGIAGLTKLSIDQYAEYEQLVGGIDTLFKGASDKVQKYASNAYKTAGMSANDYMSTATSFAASLINSFKDTSTEVTEEMANGMIKSLDKQVDAFEEATEKQIKLIDKQYNESLKLIDEEEYQRLKAVDDEIAAINALTEEEQKAFEKEEQEQRKAELKKRISSAETSEEREQAEKDLADYIEKLQYNEILEQREAEIEKLKAKKDSIKSEADTRREALKEQHDYELQTYKETRDKELDYLKEHLKQQEDAIIASIGKMSGDSSLSAEAYDKAAEYADIAIQDISDNVNRLGNDAEMVKNAYQGFAKGNFTMLDNLKLGYGGTKTEMERLLEDAERLTGVEYDIGNFADIVGAIHAIQDEMGITGATAEEAEKTISGSWGMLTGSIRNFLTGLADEDADIGALFDAVFESAGTFAKNIIPRISEVFANISGFMRETLPVVLAELPTIASTFFENAPEMLKMGADIIASIGKLIVDNLPNLLVSTIQVVTTIANGIADNIDELVPKMTEFILGLVEILTRPELLSPLIQAALAILVAISDGIYLAMTNVEWMRTYEQIILNIFDLLMENLPLIAEAGFQIIVALLSAIVDGWYTQFKSLPNAAQDFADWLTSSENVKPIFEAGVSFVKNLWDGIKSMVKWLYGKLEEIVSNIAEKFNINNIAEKLGLGDLGEVLGTGNIEFNASGIGKVGANAINTINDGISTVANKLGLGEVNLVLPDGTKFAEYLLPDLEGVSKARGTPIVQPK